MEKVATLWQACASLQTPGSRVNIRICVPGFWSADYSMDTKIVVIWKRYPVKCSQVADGRLAKVKACHFCLYWLPDFCLHWKWTLPIIFWRRRKPEGNRERILPMRKHFRKSGVKFHDFRCEPRLMDPTGKFLCKSLMNSYTNRLWEAQNWLFENSDHKFRNNSRISRWNNI